jgi:hypothetical protein
VLLLRAYHLLAKPLVDRRVRILRGRVRITVVNGINAEEKIVPGEVGIDARSPEVLTDALRWIRKGFGDAARRTIGVIQLGTVRDRPKRQQRLDDR